MDLARRIADRGSELLLFALTPPRTTTSTERAQEIADVTRERLGPLGLDGLVLYDIDDESDRNPQERPFPFLPTMDPGSFRSEHLDAWDLPVVVYRAVGKYERDDLRSWLETQDAAGVLTVFVGASSREKQTPVSLPEAQALRAEVRPDLGLGGVAIPERHTRRGDEHDRLIAKQRAGCSFFVSQVVYDVNAAKNLVSDYHYACAEQGLEPVPIIFTFSVCGSLKTLEFLGWLGVDVPRWMQNDLRNALDTLEASYQHALGAARELIGFCRHLGMPFGVNVESVSIRKAEIEASVELAREIAGELRR
ncbi:methylenetetrahydrofolate reductase [Nocardioides bruguierae]|uniref:Methylenetetrahydrofolate reductase n=1 Tax=Nocardioides bruguierae TaxID=2945102 RepID=A0A9X2IDH3_9ACTN|nr:methylenetetrahydrofolate reductase [Nocardioides bruguierae]MCM0619028.1 methylenetetrahydrofolate reductase [Nocardioides bruguierae]